MFAKSHLCSSPGMFIRLVEDGLAIGFFGPQDVVNVGGILRPFRVPAVHLQLAIWAFLAFGAQCKMSKLRGFSGPL